MRKRSCAVGSASRSIASVVALICHQREVFVQLCIVKLNSVECDLNCLKKVS